MARAAGSRITTRIFGAPPGRLIGADSGMWPTGGAWLCDHLWDHYEFNRDKAYLKTVYPIMRGAAQFFLDTLVEDPTNHWLVTNPSLSPENRTSRRISRFAPGRRWTWKFCATCLPTPSRRRKFSAWTRISQKQLAATRARLAPLQIGSQGQLQEWLQDWDHAGPEDLIIATSRIFTDLYPSAQINVYDTPKLAAAAKKSLEIRGDEATGWATAWRINLWAAAARWRPRLSKFWNFC